MLPRYWLAPAMLFAIQVAPVGVVRESNGRLRIAVGGEFGSYENQFVNCSGETVGRQTVRFRTVGGEAEAWIKPTVRVMGYGGDMTATGTSGSNLDPAYEGGFGGGLVALEGRKLGIGLGVSVAPDQDVVGTSRTWAMPYLRFGALDRVHLRLDANGPGTPGGPPERFRLSLARGYGMERRVAWRFGLGVGFFPTESDDVSGNLSGEIGIPLNRYLDLGLGGSYRAPNGGNAGGFGRIHLGRIGHQ
jgi:hypothetical protein